LLETQHHVSDKASKKYRFLAKTTTRIQIVLITYILPYYNQKAISVDYIYLKIGEKAKGQILRNGLALIEKRYHNNCKVSKTCHL
jgi:hypothetical protein